MPSDSLLVHHAAKALRVRPRTIRHWAATGKLDAFKPYGKIWHVSRAAVEARLAARAGAGEEPHGSWKSVESARAVLDQLLFAALLLLLFFSHMLTLARWACEAHDEFMRWWEGFKARRERRSRESSAGS